MNNMIALDGFSGSEQAKLLQALPIADAGQRAALIVCKYREGRSDPTELYSQFQRNHPDTPVIMVTKTPSVRRVVEAVRCGISDVLDLADGMESVIYSIDCALKQQSVTHDGFLLKWTSLSPREREVLVSVVDGKPTKIIAYELGISIKTVDIHRTNIKRKFGTQTVASLVGAVLSQGRALLNQQRGFLAAAA
jgi:two-component system, LuxR family, response regulator FixJ